MASQSHELDPRKYARKIVALSTEGISFDSMVKSFVNAGYTKEESSRHVKTILSRLESEAYIKMIEDIYLEEFSAEELKQLSQMMEYPLFKKFLGKRSVIQGKMMKVLNSVPSGG